MQIKYEKYSIYSSERTRSKTVSPATDNGQKHVNKIPKLHIWRPYTVTKRNCDKMQLRQNATATIRSCIMSRMHFVWIPKWMTTHPVTLSLGGIIKGMPSPCRHLFGVEWSKGCHKIVFLWPCQKVTEWWDSLLLRTPKNANQVWKIPYLFLRKNTFENSESCNR